MGLVAMNGDKCAVLVEKKALDRFDATCEMWIVVADAALADPDASCEVKGFMAKADALRYARAASYGNVNHRLLRITGQVLVVATMNGL
jgi:hypothetical protein